MANAPEWFTDWLVKVLDGSGIHERRGWSLLLGVTEQRLFDWVHGTLPTARAVYSILVLLEERYPEKGETLLAEWRTNAVKRMAGERKYEDWVLEPLWEDLRMAAGALPAVERRERMKSFLRTLNETRLNTPTKAVQE